MTNQHFPRPLLDDAIDRVVQELVQLDPSPGLRRRVIGRMTVPVARVWWGPRFLVPAGALAAIVLAVVLMRPDAPAPSPTAVDDAGNVVTARPSPTAPDAAAATPAASSASQSARVTPNSRSGERVPAPSRSRSGREQSPMRFTFGTRSDRVAATSVSPALPMTDTAIAHEAPGSAVIVRQPPIEVAPLAAPAAIVLLPIDLKNIVFVSISRVP